MKEKCTNLISSIVLSLLVAVGILCISGGPVLADTDPTSGLTYTITDGKATINGFTAPTGFDGTLTIPDTLGGASVTSIANYAFSDKSSLKIVTIPSSVTNFGFGIFTSCRNLTSCTISANVTSIGSSMFSYCSSMTSVTLPEGLTSIGHSAFNGCSSLTGITIPDEVTSIGNSAFDGCTSLTSISIPSGVTNIDNSLFAHCTSLTSISLPSGLKSIGNSSFQYCSALTGITIPSGVTTIGVRAFSDCTSLTGITIPNGVTNLENNAFYNCSSLTGITIPSSVTVINDRVFFLCNSMTSIDVDAENAFYKSIDGVVYSKDGTKLVCCPTGKSGGVAIPSEVTDIKFDAFYLCYNLTSIDVDAENASFKSIDGVIYSKDGTKLIWCPTGKSGSVTIPSGVTNIAFHALSHCSKLTSVVFQGTVTSIDAYTFDNEAGVTIHFVVPTGLKSHYQGLLTTVVLGKTTAVIIEVPVAVTNLTAVSAGYNSNIVIWDTVAGSAGYSIYRSTSPDSGYTYLKDVTETSYTDTGLTTGTTYYYQIQAYTMAGTLKVVSPVSASVNAKPIPAKPTGLKAISAGYNCSILTWNTVSGATGYSIYRSTSPDSGFTYLKDVTTNSFTNTGLTTGKIYYYQIKAYVMVGTNKVMSVVSDTVSAKPIPAMPTGLKATVTSTTSIKVSWNTVAGATGYSIYRSTSPDSGFAYLKGVTGSSYTNKGLTKGTTYYYRIEAYTIVGTTKVYSTATPAVGAKP